MMLLIFIVATMLVATGCTPNSAAPSTPTDSSLSSHDNGVRVFASSCSTCHTLAAAHATATIGPNLDAVNDAPSTILRQIAQGGGPPQGPYMPAHIVTGRDARDVANYVADVARQMPPTRTPKLPGETTPPHSIDYIKGDS